MVLHGGSSGHAEIAIIKNNSVNTEILSDNVGFKDV